MAYEICRTYDWVTLAESRTIATVTLLIAGLVTLVMVSRPLLPWKIALILSMGVGYSVVIRTEFLRDFFELEHLTWPQLLLVAVISAITGVAIVFSPRIGERFVPLDGDT